MAYQPIPVDQSMVKGFYVCGPGDKVDASIYPWDWERPGFDDSDWMSPGRSGMSGTPRGLYAYSGKSGWFLIPRNIPMMEETKIRFPEIIRSSEDYVNDGFINGTRFLEVPPKSKVTILLDQNKLSIGYPELWVSGGENSSIQISYAEALIDNEGLKGNRDETNGKFLKGYIDIFKPDGKSKRVFRPLWYRTFRYVELNIETGHEPLFINDFYSIFSAYPFQRIAEFKTEDPLLKDIWDVGWRTARLCATETYSDCPYYEQLQYVGDTRIQALISLYLSGDDRLMKNSILHFDHSRIPDGLTYSRFPSYIPQISPPYSLIWILMVYDYYMLKQDPEFTRQFLLGIDNVLYWFEQRLDDTGLLGKLTFPNYMDAAPGFGPAGSPPSAEEGQSAQITLLFAYALDHAAILADYHKKSDRAKQYRELSVKLKKTVHETCYDRDKKLFAETPKKSAWTQHTNILAVLADVIPEEEQKELIERIMNNDSLIPVRIYFSFYLMQAMKKVGMGDMYLENLQPWETMIKQGLTTFAEHHLEGRSDCHAWSAHPCFDFLATVCGIEAARPGFKSIKIAPNLGQLNKVTGSMPHPEGEIHVDLTRKGEDGLTGIVYIPTNLSGSFHWDGRVINLKGGRQFIEF
ncbi:alpha-L-rhamnosidase C-terminal domain-containing protein [Bacteroidota bacterium]